MADPLETEDFYDFTMPVGVAVSPSGDRAAFLAAESDPEEDRRRLSLFAVPTDGSREPHRLTRASDASQPRWSPDGTKLGFVAAREEDVSRTVGRDDEEDGEGEDGGVADADEGDSEDADAGGAEGDDEDGDDEDGEPPDPGGEGPKPQVWYYDVQLGGDAVQVTDFEEGVRGFDWGPDGDRVCVAARDPTDEQREYLAEKRDGGPIEVERLQHKADGVGFTDEVRTYLFVVDLDSGDRTRLDDAYGQGAREPLFGLQPAWAPGERIAFGSTRTENPDDSEEIDLYTIDPDGSDLRQVTETDLRATGYRWGPDGERIAFVGGNPYDWYEPADIYVARDEEGSHRSVSASLDRTAGLLPQLAWVDDGTLLAPFADEGWTRLVRLDADADDPERVFEAQGRGRDMMWFDADGDTVAVSLSDPTDGHDLYSMAVGDVDAGEDRTTRLTELNAELLADTALPRARRVTYENGDGVEIEGILYLPDGDADESDRPYPTVVNVHGGPMAYDAPSFVFDNTFWTGQGYAVLCPNYRGSTSYGEAFASRLKGTRGDLERDDVVSGVEHLVGEGIADPDRLFVTGFSYGGITTANVVTMEEEPFAAAAAEHGIYDLRSTFGTDDNHNWHEWEFGLPWEAPETYDRISSITDVGNVDTPLLVTAGEEDWRCPPTQAEQLYVSVRKQGVDAKLVIYQDEHHNVGDPDRAIHRLETLTDWFREYDPGYEGEEGEGTDGESDDGGD